MRRALAYLNAYATVAEKPRPALAPGILQHGAPNTRAWVIAHRERSTQEGVRICGRSALPTSCAFPVSRASSESGEMLAFAHIPTGPPTMNLILVK
jgi:hypothetical protein